MVVVSSTLTVGQIADALDANCQPIGALGEAIQQAFPRFADDLAWWTEAAKAQRAQATAILRDRLSRLRVRSGRESSSSGLSISYQKRTYFACGPT